MTHLTPKATSNSIQCRALGQSLHGVSFRDEFYKRPFLAVAMPDELRMRMLFFSVAICHQTYALQNTQLNLFGWDYLEYGFLNIALKSPNLLDPNQISATNANLLASMLAPFFSHNADPANSTLDRPNERARLMLSSAQWLVEKHKGMVATFLHSTNKTLSAKPSGYYQQLQSAPAFADPLRKKSTFLLKLLSDASLYHINDTENLIPVMDYHMQRVLLRTGCVVVTDPLLTAALQQRTPLESDSDIREASVEAIKIVAQQAQLNPLLMNDIFYMLGRSCCLEHPLCMTHRCDKNPCSLTLTLNLTNHNHCLFTGICKGETDATLRSLWHPVVETHFY